MGGAHLYVYWGVICYFERNLSQLYAYIHLDVHPLWNHLFLDVVYRLSIGVVVSIQDACVDDVAARCFSNNCVCFEQCWRLRSRHRIVLHDVSNFARYYGSGDHYRSQPDSRYAHVIEGNR